jgi:ATP-dependent protease ClpP protease subunit
MQHDNLMLLPKPNRIRTETRTSEQNTHIIEIYEALEQPTDWSDELHLINTASEMDTIVLDICTPGGCGDTAFLFNRALRSTQAHTIAIIGPQCSSAGSILALSCREWVLDETSEMMLHTSQYGMIGKEVDVYEHVTFSRKRLEKLFNIAYKGFLSDDEIKMLIAGTPMYFDSEDLAERLDNLVAYREDLEDQKCEFGDSDIDDPEEPFNLKTLIKEAVQEALAEKDGINQEAYLEWVEAVKEANKKEKPKRPPRPKKPVEDDGIVVK